MTPMKSFLLRCLKYLEPRNCACGKKIAGCDNGKTEECRTTFDKVAAQDEAYVRQRIAAIERFCEVFSEDQNSYDEWKRIVENVGVSGVAVHDARLVAVILTSGIGRILTLNAKDFHRYESEGLKILTPERYLESTSTTSEPGTRRIRHALLPGGRVVTPPGRWQPARTPSRYLAANGLPIARRAACR